MNLELEDELAADLTNTSGSGVRDLTELIAVRIAHRSAGEEVGVVEDVEKLDAKVELRSLGEFRIFLQARIGVNRSRPVEEELLRAARHTADLEATAEVAGKRRRVEKGMCWSMRVELLDRSYLVGIVKPDVGQSEVVLPDCRFTGVPVLKRLMPVICHPSLYRCAPMKR